MSSIKSAAPIACIRTTMTPEEQPNTPQVSHKSNPISLPSRSAGPPRSRAQIQSAHGLMMVTAPTCKVENFSRTSGGLWLECRVRCWNV